MKKEAKNELDKELLKSKVKFYAVFAVPVIIMAMLFTMFFPVSSSNINAVAIKYTAEQTDTGNIPIMWAKLDDGAVVRVSMPVNVELRNEANVEIIKTNTLVGISTYKFMRYVH